ncbi:NACHT domain-containing protein [Streptomyces sp. NPDC058308]|uniref:NACHT domain-containing protein n=1 Tax=Streptomyces sp. NPDC058308 TaxID=3346440 RepID=UPI0036E2A510
MEPVVRTPSALSAPLVRRLFRVPPRPPKCPDLIAAIATWRGPDAPADPDEVHRTAAEFIQLAAETHSTPTRELPEVADVLTRTLLAIGELDLTDADAVRLGPQDYARRLRGAVQGADRRLSPGAAWFHDELLVAVCLHVLHHLVRRSPYIQRHLAERASRIRQLVDLSDAEAAAAVRRPEPSREDADFETAYAQEVVRQHGWLTIVGVDFANAPDRWPLEDTYLSLQAEENTGGPPVTGGHQRTVLLADRALEGHERVLLRGVAGSGKTTLVQWLAVAAAREGARVPFVLPVRRFAREGFPAPDDFLRAVRHPLAGQAPEGWVVRTLLAGRALLLVDGIDEAPEETRGALRDQLRRLLRIFSGTACLVTSRPSAVEDGWLSQERLAEEGFTELSLAPMSRDQVTRFIRDWHTAAMGDDQYGEQPDREDLKEYEQRLLNSVRIYRELRQLATNPLMCGLICALNRDRSGSLPKGRKELYDAALEMLLQRRDPERDVLYADDVRLQQGARELLLRKLAHAMLAEGLSELPRRRVVEVLDGALPAIPSARAAGDGEKIFRHLLHRTGLLREQAGVSVDFIHRTFQDYLAAKEIVARGHLHTLVDHAHQPEWEEVIRMAAAHARPDECAGFLERLLAAAPGLRRPHVNHRRLMAAACLEHVSELDPAMQELVHRRTKNLLRPTTEQGARSLGWVGPIVLEQLPDPEQVPGDQQALLLAITATRVQDDAAIDYLARLRTRSSLAIRTELARPWRHFDTDRYAHEIIAHLGPEGLYFPVSDAAELAALRGLGGRPRIQVAGIMRTDELLAGLVPDRLTHLWVNAELPDPDMAWLARFPHLRVLRVNPRLPRVRNVPEGVTITA